MERLKCHTQGVSCEYAYLRVKFVEFFVANFLFIPETIFDNYCSINLNKWCETIMRFDEHVRRIPYESHAKRHHARGL